VADVSGLAAPVRFASVPEALAAVEGSWTVIDANVLRLYAPRLDSERAISVPSGERSKSRAGLERLWRWLAESGAGRSSTLAAVGGGVVGDLAGFAAATYMRGIRLVHVPTTLMAMVDSAHGGKTGIDLPAGKNLVGAFYAAAEVVVAPGFLATLPRREFRSGAAEVWKYGVIALPRLLEALEARPLAPDGPELESTVRQCVEAKLRIVLSDPLERTGARAALNFGHTVAHAIEAEAGYGRLRHGEAVAVGIVVEARLGERLGKTERGLSLRLAAGLARQGLPTSVPPGLDTQALVRRMGADKKRTGDGLAFSLALAPGECTLVRGVDPAEVVEALHPA
jgi:3-dehydroquinate synthase